MLWGQRKGLVQTQRAQSHFHIVGDWHALNLAKEQEIQYCCQGGHTDSPPDLGREARFMLLCSNLP